MLRCRGGMRGAPKSPARGSLGAKGRGTRSPGGGGRQMGGSDGGEDLIHHMPPSRGGRGRGSGNHKRSTLVHSGMQETLDEDDRSASLKAIQEAHRIMMMQHCRQSWEDTEYYRIWPPTQSGNRDNSPEYKSAGLHSTNLLLQTEVHKDNTRPTLPITQPQFSDGSTQRPDDILTHGTTGPSSVKEAKEPTNPTKETPNSQAVTDLKPIPDQSEYSAVTGIGLPATHRANPERDQELLARPTPQGQEGPCLGLQPHITDTVESILPAPAGPGRRRKGQPATRDSTQDRAMSTLPNVEAKTALPDTPTER